MPKPLMDFANVAAAALAHTESLLSVWLPHGKRQGREWIARNPTRADAHPGSFAVNTLTGAWADFATGDKGGDLISLCAYLEGTTQAAAAEAVAGRFGLPWGKGGIGRRTAIARKQRERPAPTPESPPRAKFPRSLSGVCPPPEIVHPTKGKPSAVWEYTDPEGRPVGFACRFDFATGKEVLPFFQIGDRWQWKAPPDPRPLFNLAALLARPDCPVVVVEGEKAAAAAGELFPEAVAVTWQGGCKAWARTDWDPLTGRLVVLWPDADAPGIETMKALRDHLKARHRPEGVGLPNLPEGLPAGFDAADLAGEGLGREWALRLLNNAPLPLPPFDYDEWEEARAMGLIYD